MWRFSKKILVAEKSSCKALSIGRHLGISSLLLKSAENTEKLTFVSLKLCFLGFVNRHNELFFSYLWSFVHEFTSSSTNHTLFNYNIFKAEFLFMLRCMLSKVTSLNRGLCTLVHSLLLLFFLIYLFFLFLRTLINMYLKLHSLNSFLTTRIYGL